MTPNHADKTQPVQHSKAEGPGEGTSPQTTALRSCRVGARVPLPATPLLLALGRHPSVTITTKREAYEARAPASRGIRLRRAYASRNTPF